MKLLGEMGFYREAGFVGVSIFVVWKDGLFGCGRRWSQAWKSWLRALILQAILRGFNRMYCVLLG